MRKYENDREDDDSWLFLLSLLQTSETLFKRTSNLETEQGTPVHADRLPGVMAVSSHTCILIHEHFSTSLD